MLENEYNELNKYTIRASQSTAMYYDTLETLTEKQKLSLVEKILAELDIVLLWTMNIRHQILQQISNLATTQKIQMNQHLSELKTTQDTAKTLSFNFTAIYHSTRDMLKQEINQ